MTVNDWNDDSDDDTKPILIPTDFGGPVTEWARRQAAENMRLNHPMRDKVVELIGLDKAKERYPEAGWDEV